MNGFACIGLYAPKTDYNIGGALRAASCYQVSLVAIQGRKRVRHITDTLKAWRHIPILRVASLLDILPFNCMRIGVEITPDAQDLCAFVHPQRGMYIFGPEDGSLNTAVLEKCHAVVRVPTRGCMNLAATVNVVLYDRLSKQVRS